MFVVFMLQNLNDSGEIRLLVPSITEPLFSFINSQEILKVLGLLGSLDSFWEDFGSIFKEKKSL